jgi:hypothetical protein
MINEPRPSITAERMYGPVSFGRPKKVATLPKGPIKFGPTTEPIVEAQTTRDKLFALVEELARSTAA